MRCVALVILHALVAQARAKEVVANRTNDVQGCMDKMVDKLVDKLIGHSAIPYETPHFPSSMLPRPSSLLSPSSNLGPSHPYPAFGNTASFGTGSWPQLRRQATSGRDLRLSRARNPAVRTQFLDRGTKFLEGIERIKVPTNAILGFDVPMLSQKYSLIASGAVLPDPKKEKTGGEDGWFSKAYVRGGGVIAVADGISAATKSGEGDAGLYAKVLTYEAVAAAAQRKSKAQGVDPKAVIAAAQKKTKLAGAATLCVVELDGSKLRSANVGDSGFRIVRQGEVVFASSPSQYKFNLPYQLASPDLTDNTNTANDADITEFTVQAGDIVVVGSDGLFDNVFDKEIARVATEVAGRSALSIARVMSYKLAVIARTYSSDPKYESPFSVEWQKAQSGIGGFVTKDLLKIRPGGKVDDITVVVGVVVETEGDPDLKEAVTASEREARLVELGESRSKLS